MLNSMNQNLWLMTLYSAQRGEPTKPIFFSLQPTQVPVTIIVCMYLYIYMIIYVSSILIHSLVSEVRNDILITKKSSKIIQYQNEAVDSMVCLVQGYHVISFVLQSCRGMRSS